jgi:diacylglycerol kinase
MGQLAGGPHSFREARLKNFLRGFAYAWSGIRAGARGRNFRIMLAVAAVVILSGYFLRISPPEWALLVLAMGLVLSLELLNTAGEKLVDILSPNHDPRYGQVKDLLAGGVLVAAVAAAVMAAIVFWPKLF